MMDNEDKSREGLDGTVRDAYIIYAEKPGLSAWEQEQRYTALLQKADELQQQFGSGKFGYRKFEYVKAIAAVIKESSIVEALKGEGYVVEKQGIMRAQGVEQQTSLWL